MTAERNHSAGPWRQVVNKDGEIWLCPRGDAPGTGHSLYLGDIEYTCGECHANFDLITIAPELLAVCYTLLSMGDEHFDYGIAVEAFEMARAAVSKLHSIARLH